MQKPDGEIVHGFGGTTRNVPPYVIPFERNIRIQNKGNQLFNIVLQQVGIYNSVEVGQVLTKFSQVVLSYIETVESFLLPFH